jgi:hypothetical protein
MCSWVKPLLHLSIYIGPIQSPIPIREDNPTMKYSFASGNFCFDSIDNIGFGDGAEVSGLVAIAVYDLAHDASHDMCAFVNLMIGYRCQFTFPEQVLGKSQAIMTFLGAAKDLMTLRTWRMSSFAKAGSSSYLNSLGVRENIICKQWTKEDEYTHGLRVTNAKTACPVSSSAVPITDRAGEIRCVCESRTGLDSHQQSQRHPCAR